MQFGILLSATASAESICMYFEKLPLQQGSNVRTHAI
jgi:hypothetical protein